MEVLEFIGLLTVVVVVLTAYKLAARKRDGKGRK